MRVFCLVVFLAVLCLRVVAYTAANAVDPYLGTWKIAGATAAPWATPQRKPDADERARLISKAIVFKSKAIAGPQPFACQGPHYNLTDYTADLLFQGAFDEMHRQDQSLDPGKIAAGLGFTRKAIRTLETGCEFEFHFVDASTAQVALNNVAQKTVGRCSANDATRAERVETLAGYARGAQQCVGVLT